MQLKNKIKIIKVKKSKDYQLHHQILAQNFDDLTWFNNLETNYHPFTGTYLLFANKQIVGECRFRVVTKLKYDKSLLPFDDLLILSSLSILKNYRQMGYGSILLNFFLNQKNQHKALHVERSNKGALKLYQRNHFQIVGKYKDQFEDGYTMVWHNPQK